MKCRLVIVVIVFFFRQGFSQDFKTVDRYLLEEKSFQAIFYLDRIQINKNSPDLLRFMRNNRRIESLLLMKEVSRDSISLYIQQNQLLLAKIKNNDETAYYHFLEGFFLNVQNQTDEAEKKLTTSGVRGGVLRAKSLQKLAEISRVPRRKFQQSSDYAKEALSLYRTDSLSNYFKLYKCHILLGLNAKDQKNYSLAEREYLQCLAILDNIPDPQHEERAKVLNNLGNVYNERNDYAKARETYSESVRLKEKYVKDSASLATSYGNIGAFYKNLGDLEQAEISFDKSLHFTPSTANPRIKNVLTYNYCTMLGEVGDFEKVTWLLEAAVENSTNPKLIAPTDASIFRLHNALTQNAVKLSDFPRAARERKECLSILKNYDATDPLYEEFYFSSSELFLMGGQFDSCRYYSEKLIKALKERHAEKNEWMARALGALAQSGMEQGKPAEALPAFRASSKIYEDVLPSRHKDVIGAINNLAYTHLALNDLDSAIHYALLAINRNVLSDIQQKEFHELYLHPKEAAASFYLLSSSNFEKYKKTNDQQFLKTSTEYVSLMVELIQSIRFSFEAEADRLTFGQSISDAFTLSADIYFEAYKVLDAIKYLDKLFRVSETAKSQVLMADLKEQKIQRFAGVTERIQKKELTLSRKEREMNHSLALLVTTGTNESFKDEIQRNIHALQQEKQVFIDSMRDNLPDYFELKYDQTMVDIKTLQAQLPKDAAVLEFITGDKTLYVIFIMKEKSVAMKLADLKKVKSLVSSMRNIIDFKVESEFHRVSNTLFKALLSSCDSVVMASRKNIKELYVVPEGILNILPMEALVTSPPDKKLSYVIEKYNVSYNYSSTLLWQKITDGRQLKGMDLLGVAPVFEHGMGSVTTVRDENESEFHNGLPELTETRSELEYIKSIYSRSEKGQSRIMNEKVSEREFKQTDFSKYRFVHVATHGFANGDALNKAGLAFSRVSGTEEDDILYVKEVFAMQIPCDLVTLSACETGLGKFYPGEGVIGLTRSFFYSGSKSLVVSLWKVQDKSTSELMRSFYSYMLKEKKSKPEALRLAKLEMIRSDHYKSPYYWAPFILTGKP